MTHIKGMSLRLQKWRLFFSISSRRAMSDSLGMRIYGKSGCSDGRLVG
ncbi:MAG: hypothetical protein JNK70_12015 [Phycisphaerae bacterium]|nr:hypothetical protein [Phycisphaerae bacterium]